MSDTKGEKRSAVKCRIRGTFWKTVTEKIVFAFMLSLMYIVSSLNVNAQNNVEVYINGVQLKSENTAYILDGRTMVGAREIFEALGASVTWDGDERKVTICKDSTTAELFIDKNVFTVNGEERTLDVPAIIQDNITYVPARAISQALGAYVEWIDDIRTVNVTTNGVETMSGYPAVLLPCLPQGTEVTSEFSDAGVKYTMKCKESEDSYMASGIIDVISLYEKAMEGIGWNKNVKSNPGVLTETLFYGNIKSDCRYEVAFFTKKLGNGEYEFYVYVKDYITVYNTKDGEVRYITENDYITVSEYKNKDIWKKSTGKTITVYDRYNNPFEIADYELYKYLNSGMTTEMKTVTMYCADGSEIRVGIHLTDKYTELGYYTEPVVKMYSPDGDFGYVGRSQIYTYIIQGWSETPFETELYSHDGRTIKVNLHEKDKYLSEGWFEELLIPLYSSNGETVYVPSEQKQYYIACGWSENAFRNNEQGNENIVYITPGGLKYHISKSCAGAGAITVHLDEIEGTYEPCKTCCS